MKIFLSLFLVISFSITSFAQIYIGDVTLNTQIEVEAFGAFDFTKIQGNLKIDSTNCTDLSSLSTLTEVIGTVSIKKNDSLQSLNGLHNITSMIDLYIINNDMLTSLNGLNNLSSILHNLSINQNDNLINFNGLEDLNFVANDFYVLSNYALETLSGLDNLSSMYYETGRLAIAYNSNLTSMNSLNALTQCSELIIHGNPALTNLHAFNSLKKAREINFYMNNELISLDSAFLELDTLRYDIHFEEQPKLSDLYNFRTLKSCEDIIIQYNNGLKSLDFNSLSSCNNIEINYNDSLISIGDFNALTDPNTFNLIGNPQLDHLPHFPVLELISGLTLRNLSSIETLEGLENISTINFFWLKDNDKLTNLYALSNLTNGIDLNINNNQSLKSLDGLENVTNCTGINLQNNDSLSSYCALNNLVNSLDPSAPFYYTVSNNLYNPLLSDLQGGNCITCPSYPIDLTLTSTLQSLSSNQDYATYQWLDYDNNYAAIPNDTLQTLSSSTHGHVAVKINYHGCIDTTLSMTNCAAYPIDLSITDSGQVFTSNQDSATYQWLDCDNGYAVISGDTNQTFSSSIYGNVALEITYHGCVDTTACIINCAGYTMNLSTTESQQNITANQDSAIYQWLDCDNGYAVISGDTNQSFSSSIYGNVAVEIQFDGCIDTTDCITNCGAFPIDLTITDSAQIFTANQDSATYQWLDCDNELAIISGETAQSFSSTIYGNIAVEINRNGCLDTSACITNCAAYPIDPTVSEENQLFTANQDSATYQWLDCENGYAIISGETGQSFSSSIYGNIAVEINRNGCLDTSACITNCAAYPIDLTVSEENQLFTANQDSATYQWLDCENGYAIIFGETGQSFSSSIYGNIAVEINRNGCLDTSACITNCAAYPIDLTVSEENQLFTANQDSATYQWLDCENGYAIISGETEQSFSSTIYGNIAVEINRNGCLDTTTCITNCAAYPIDISVTETGLQFTANQDSATYQWLDCENNFAIIPNDTNQTFSSVIYGNVAVEINYFGCVDTSYCITNCSAYSLDLSVEKTGQQLTANQHSATYQWLDCDNNYAAIPNDTNQTFSSETYGNVAVEINYFGCIDTTACVTNCGAYPIDLSVSESDQHLTANQDSATYQWLDCNNNNAVIPNATSQTFSSETFLNVAVEINYFGCIDTSACINILGTTNNPFDYISMAPNPITDYIQINFGNLKNLNLIVYNQIGQIVYQEANINQKIYTLNTSTFSSGLYLIEIYDTHTRKQFKIIK